MRKLVPVFLALLGLLIGGGTGLFLRPGADAHAPPPETAEADRVATYVKMNNQFVIPLVESGRVASLVVMTLSLEVTAGSTEAVYAKEPKLRDAFLQVMFDHANAGGFKGVFTDGSHLDQLRRALNESAKKILGDMLYDVLISEIVRQDN